MAPFRKGVGRLVAAAAQQGQHVPLVVPFVHAGMEHVLPVGAVLPQPGQTVSERKLTVPISQVYACSEDLWTGLG